MSAASEPSNQVRIEPDGPGRYLLAGVLSFETVPSLWRRSEALLQGVPELKLDLKGITRTDSAGLALLVEWTRLARQRGIRISFLNIPPQVLAIARVSGLDDILPLSRD